MVTGYLKSVRLLTGNVIHIENSALYLAGWPSRWGLPHILVLFGFVQQTKLAIRQLFGARKYSALYRIVSFIRQAGRSTQFPDSN